MERGDRPVSGYILGDSAYMLRQWLMTPLAATRSRREENYNYAHSSTRCTVERAIGVCKQRWQCLRRLRLEPSKACDVVIACCILHNRARSLRLPDLVESDCDSADDLPASDAEGNLFALFVLYHEGLL